MRSSHAPSLLTHIKRFFSKECIVAPGTNILVAISGGPDSMALLHGLALARNKFGFNIFAHGVNHGLRAEASAELELAQNLCRKMNVEMTHSNLQVALGGNLMSRARDARFAVLEERAKELGNALIATAHHADDRAETIMMRLIRGTGVKGLAALPGRAGNRIRPIIRARKADVLLHCERHNIPFATDPSNKNYKFLRAHVRGELMPLLEKLSPNIVDHLTRIADEIEEQK